MKEFSRRQFIKTVGAVGAGMAAGVLGYEFGKPKEKHPINPVFGIEFDGDNERISFEEASALAKRFDKAFDKLPEIKFDDSRNALYTYAAEIIPQFAYEGFEMRPKFPSNIEYILFEDGDAANHVLGRSNCQDYAVLNIRMALPRSSWADGDELFTLIHELAHTQQGKTKDGCRNPDGALVENTAQIAAAEVCAGLANQGNIEYLAAFVGEIRGMAISTAYGAALNDKRMDEFMKLRGELSPGAMSAARFAKSARRWASDQFHLKEIIKRYNETPLKMIISAGRGGNGEIKGLAFPPVYSQDESSRWTIYTTPIPPKIDDTLYIFEHLEEMVNDVAKGDK